MEILFGLPDDLKINIFNLCPLGHRIFLEKFFFDSEGFLNEKLQELFPSFSFKKDSWEYKIRTLVNHFKYLLPRLAFDFREDEWIFRWFGEYDQLEHLEEKREQVFDEMLCIINFFYDV